MKERTYTQMHKHVEEWVQSWREDRLWWGLQSQQLPPPCYYKRGFWRCMPGAWGAETITCLHGGSVLALELVSRLPACVPLQRLPVVCWLTSPLAHICPLTLCSSLISCSCLHSFTGFVRTLLLTIFTRRPVSSAATLREGSSCCYVFPLRFKPYNCG